MKGKNQRNRRGDESGLYNKPNHFEQQAERLHSPGRWFRMSKDLFQILSIPEAVFLAVLINVSERISADERRPGWDGWFYYRISSAEQELRMSRNRQMRILQMLVRKKFVEREFRGLPAKRYFRIRFGNIELAVQKSAGATKL